MGDLIKVGKGSLEGMAADIKGTHNNLKSGFEDLTGELLRTLPEWGEGTASRQSYDEFKRKVDKLFTEMFDAVAKMPPVVIQAAEEAQATENRTRGCGADGAPTAGRTAPPSSTGPEPSTVSGATRTGSSPPSVRLLTPTRQRRGDTGEFEEGPVNIAMMPDAVMAAAKQNDANTAEALKAAQDAVKALVVLKGYGIFGTSPAGKSTDAVFAKASGVIDDLIEEVNQAITVLTQNLHASVDAVLKDQEVSQVDYAKLTQDNKDRVDNLGDTGIKPGDDNYVAPVATTGPSGTDPATQPGTDPGTQPGTDPGADPDATSTSS